MNNGESHDDDDAAWLLGRERGAPGATVSAATMARYARLEALIADLPAAPGNVRPRAAWKQDVLAMIDERSEEMGGGHPAGFAGASQQRGETAPGGISAAEAGPAIADGTAPIARAAPAEPVAPPRRRTARRWAIGAAGLAAAAAMIVLVAREPGRVDHERTGNDPNKLASLHVAQHAFASGISFEIAPGERPHRSTDASVGDTLTVRGKAPATGELRIYDATGTERARCAVALAAPPGCTVEPAPEGATLRLEMSLREPGALRAVLFAALPAAKSDGIDRDIDAAQRAGITVTTRALVDVH